jgi:hypothetical protein
MSRKTMMRQTPISMLGQALLGLVEACRDIRVITRAG